MDLIKRTFNDLDKPEVISITFPDRKYADPEKNIGLSSYKNEEEFWLFHSQDTGLRGAWYVLASTKAKELGITFDARVTQDGFEVATLSKTDMIKLQQAIAPEWPEKVKRCRDRIVHFLHLDLKLDQRKGEIPTRLKTDCEQAAAQWNVSIDELLENNQELHDFYHS